MKKSRRQRITRTMKRISPRKDADRSLSAKAFDDGHQSADRSGSLRGSSKASVRKTNYVSSRTRSGSASIRQFLPQKPGFTFFSNTHVRFPSKNHQGSPNNRNPSPGSDRESRKASGRTPKLHWRIANATREKSCEDNPFQNCHRLRG